MDSARDQISARAAALIRDRENIILLSHASVWEMQIKIMLGKLQLSTTLASVLQAQQVTNGVELLPITLSHILALENLPDLHCDPFDRLLIAQAITEGIVIITKDPLVMQYPVTTVW
jgi:PIN domain nuclease of toxin-antitoxin system